MTEVFQESTGRNEGPKPFNLLVITPLANVLSNHLLTLLFSGLPQKNVDARSEANLARAVGCRFT